MKNIDFRDFNCILSEEFVISTKNFDNARHIHRIIAH